MVICYEVKVEHFLCLSLYFSLSRKESNFKWTFYRFLDVLV